MILGSEGDLELNADIALHFWYSAFIPAEYDMQIRRILRDSLERGSRADGVLETTTATGTRVLASLSRGATAILEQWISWDLRVKMPEATKEYDRVMYMFDLRDDYSANPFHIRFAKERGDHHHRMYCTLRPSHRLALAEFRLLGIVLPYGAPNAHFNVPNQSLFGPDNQWLLFDGADPFEGWE